MRHQGVEILRVAAAGVRRVDEQRRLRAGGGVEDKRPGIEGRIVLFLGHGQSLRWQADQRPAAISRRAGRSTRQRSVACGQRGGKWQPLGGSSGEGISPFTGWERRLRRSRRGTSDSSAWGEGRSGERRGGKECV